MILERFRLKNYKSFRDSGDLSFQPGFNILVGKNSAGKTALVEGMSGRAEPNPHRSPLSLPNSTSRLSQIQGAASTFQLERADAEAAMFEGGFALPIVPQERNNVTYIAETPERFLSSAPIEVVMRHIGARSASIERRHLEAHVQEQAQFVASPDGQTLIFAKTWANTEPGAPIASLLANWAMSRVYLLTAQRFGTPKCAIGTREELLSDASNLAEVLHNLRAKEMRFQKFNQLVSTVFPEIKWVGTRVDKGGSPFAEVIISMVPPEDDRPEFLIPLSDAGTGIGQVLALLYVVLNAPTGRTIIVDEPQSFLHPGALRKLVSVLKQHGKRHQFIFTTHAPQLIVHAEPSTVTQVWLEGYETKVRQMTNPTPREIQGILLDVGARLSDTFGADAILWVEGQSEELAFPIIVERVANAPTLGVQILSVVSTSAFEEHRRVDAKTVRAIYARLAAGGWLVPPSVGFLFDREARNLQEREQLEKESNQKITFLPRRMFENYLLHPAAIAAIINEDLPGCTTHEEIKTTLMDAEKNGKGLTTDAKKLVSRGSTWRDETHAANILRDLFRDVCSDRLEFQKTDHSVRLALWLVENSPAELSELANVIAKKIAIS